MFRIRFAKNYFGAASKLSFIIHSGKVETRVIPKFTTEVLSSNNRTFSFLGKMSSGIKNAEKEKKSPKKSFLNEGCSGKKITRSITSEAEKNWKEHYLNLPLEDKRKEYSCGKKYVVLDKVESWSSYASNLDKSVSPYDVNEELNMKISMWRGDITCLEIDVICNAANGSLLGGGGVDGAIHRAAGKKLYEECVKLNGCDTGSAKLTGGYKLPARYILHTVGPIGEKPGPLASCYKTCLDLAKENNLRTIAFPCISTGIYGYDVEKATPVVMETVRNWLLSEDNSQSIDKIIFCVFLMKDVDVYKENLLKYFPVEKFTGVPEKKKPKTEDSTKSDSKGKKDTSEKKKAKNEDLAKSEKNGLSEEKKPKTEGLAKSESKEQKELSEKKKPNTADLAKSESKEHKGLSEEKKPKTEVLAKSESKEQKEVSEKKKPKTDDSSKSEIVEAKQQKENKNEEQPVTEAAKTISDIENKEKKRNKSKNDTVKVVVQESCL